MCVCVCVSVCAQQTGQSDQLKWELNADSSKTVKAIDFKLDVHVPRDSPDSGHDPLKIFRKEGVARVTSLPKFLGIIC